MFNPKKILTFWSKVLRLLPLYFSLAFLILVAQLTTTPPVRGWQLGLRLAGGLVPATLAIVAACALSTAYMQALYALKGKREAFWFLVHCMFGQASIKPWLLVENGKMSVAGSGPESLIAQVGGPGTLVIRKDTAAVLEKKGRLSGVEGPGFAKLEPFERVYDILDLRPRRWQLSVSGMSKEGISVTCDTDLEFQIQDGGQQPTGDMPYPMDPNAVFLASTNKWIREAHRPEGDRMLDWKGLIAISATEGTLRSILARYPLDRLIAPEKEGEDHPRRLICRELEEVLRTYAPNVGAKMLKVELGEIKVSDEVTQQWINTWRADWDRWGDEYLAEAEAYYVNAVGSARRELVEKRITTLTNVLHAMAQEAPQAFYATARVQLNLILRNLGTDSLALTYLPTEATKVLVGLPVQTAWAKEEDKDRWPAGQPQFSTTHGREPDVGDDRSTEEGPERQPQE